jgi:hypothetical protein
MDEGSEQIGGIAVARVGRFRRAAAAAGWEGSKIGIGRGEKKQNEIL